MKSNSLRDNYFDTQLQEGRILECMDLNEYLIKNKAASFFVRVAGDSMEGAGIMDGDVLLIDRSLDPGHNKIVVAIVNNEMTLKRLSFKNDRIYLAPENKNYQPIEITEYMDCYIWGVVSAVIRKM